MVTAYFIRHGLTQENKEGRIQGQLPGTISLPETERYLAATVPLLREKKLHLLISSDLDRAIESRRILKEFLQLPDLPEEVSPLLREKTMGFYEGMLWSEVPAAFREQRGLDAYDFRSFGGENDEDVRGRVATMLRHLAQRGANLHICCVTHAGWIKQLVALADKEGVLPDGWTNRTAIYEAGLGPLGQFQYFHPVAIKAELPEGD